MQGDGVARIVFGLFFGQFPCGVQGLFGRGIRPPGDHGRKGVGHGRQPPHLADGVAPKLLRVAAAVQTLMMLQNSKVEFVKRQVDLEHHFDSGQGMGGDLFPFVLLERRGLVQHITRQLGDARVVQQQAEGQTIQKAALEFAFLIFEAQPQTHGQHVEGMRHQGGILGEQAAHEQTGAKAILRQVFGENHDVFIQGLETGQHRLLIKGRQSHAQGAQQNIGRLAFLEVGVHQHQVGLLGDMFHVDGMIAARDEKRPFAAQGLHFLHLFVGQPLAFAVQRIQLGDVFPKPEQIDGRSVLGKTRQYFFADLIVFFRNIVGYSGFFYFGHAISCRFLRGWYRASAGRAKVRPP